MQGSSLARNPVLLLYGPFLTERWEIKTPCESFHFLTFFSPFFWELCVRRDLDPFFDGPGWAGILGVVGVRTFFVDYGLILNGIFFVNAF